MRRLAILSITAVISIVIGFVASYFIFMHFFNLDIRKNILLNEHKSSEDGSLKLPKEDKNQDESSDKIPLRVKSEFLPEKFKMKWEISKDVKPEKNFSRDYDIAFGSSDEFSELNGVTCFRGNNYRNSPGFGYADIREEKLEPLWSNKISYIDIWTGVGWTGQPAIVQWNDSVRKIMNITPDKKSKKGLKEVIYATLDGNIYFYDLEDGVPTRAPIRVGYPHKGSLSIDPRGYPLLYAGQGIEQVAGKPVPIGYRIYSLIDQKLLHFIDGYDPFALRKWAAFDSNCLIDKNTDTFIECGENGVLYSGKLNTKFDLNKKSISIHPELVKYRYTTAKSTQLGTENSPAIYKNYIYFADNSGILQCVDLKTLKPVWVRYLNDDTDSTTVLEEISDSEVYLYTACEVDKQGNNGSSYVRKINALTGELLWEKSYPCFYDTSTNGGTLASPVIGKHEIENLVIFNIAKTGTKTGGKLIAFDKKSGKEVWVKNLKYYCWSSPVDVYTKDGKAYLIICDSGGLMSLLDAKTGKTLHEIPLEANIEGSPAVYDDIVVVGTRGQKIWGIKIK
ncbi:MAG: PQQ-binding-like beta-propeller repeat protein [Clostridia bacterium]|nr:PQQ-binding-like beta-propeller repeat protein [Clostridia bacterium]